jgi:hypothetical protein
VAFWHDLRQESPLGVTRAVVGGRGATLRIARFKVGVRPLLCPPRSGAGANLTKYPMKNRDLQATWKYHEVVVYKAQFRSI